MFTCLIFFYIVLILHIEPEAKLSQKSKFFPITLLEVVLYKSNYIK